MIKSQFANLLGSLVLTVCFVSHCFSQQQSDQISFNDDIRPILSSKCISCHGPDEGDRHADLRLDTFEGATEMDSIVPGEPDESELIARVETDDEDSRMPPMEHGDGLTKEEIDLLRRWIEQGGGYETHWAFVAPKQHEPPEVTAGRVHNEIDNFILSEVQKAGLTQNPPAKPNALMRRLSLDLTGLPPSVHDEATVAAIDAFLLEATEENYANVVDLLLDSEAYGEHWTSMWLDLARYADTVGYSGDEYREIWPWRDWLIDAIAENRPYDQLVTEMLAGDLLPESTAQQQLATAFHRNTLNNNEGGTNDEEFRTIAVKDRLSTTLNAFMGLTVRCAECHSHKYDPISQTEYYQLLDFFNQTVDADKRDDRPKLEYLPRQYAEQNAKLEQKISDLEKQAAKRPPLWTVRRPDKTESRDGTKFEVLDDESILATGKLPNYDEYRFTFTIPSGETVRGLRIEVIPDKKYDGKVGRAPSGAFIVTQFRLGVHENGSERLLEFSDAAADFSQPNRHILSTIKSKVDGKKFDQGWAVNHPKDEYRVRREAIFTLKEPLNSGPETEVTLYVLHDGEWSRLNVGRMRVATTSVDSPAKRYRDKTLDPLFTEIASLKKQIKTPLRVPVLRDLPQAKRRQTHVMGRGNFASKQEKVSAGVLSQLHAMPDTLPMNRLGMAGWIFDSENPLTARVAVNRYWSRLFGIGIVETEEDFGTQGIPPTHPELLDSLAVDFQASGWDVKQLLKKIVTSATYQQSPSVDSKAHEIDPRNLLWSRGPRIRMTAEVIRDQSLAVSGLLSQKKYGPPVYPPSPIKRIVNAFTGGMTWVDSQGEDRYRRTLYTYIKRSQPHPLLETFDMSTRDVCSMRRLRTNTPLQSFMTLNDIMFVEMARALADRMVNESPSNDVESRIAHGLELALYRDAKPWQVEVLSELYQSALARFEADPSAAAKMMGETDLKSEALLQRASLTVVANVILNLDDFLNN
ncbi:PSD1 and planctomycete cytochrome C domain-containing protein [Mariniblastus fucicola]|nr:PSD1 and planctomycete cytochrome C domain-containing protein [Mariniblastus fucicola]